MAAQARTPIALLAIRGIGIAVLAVIGIAFTPLPNRVAAVLRPAGPERAADAIVVLGGGVNADGAPTPSSLLRLVRGLTLYRQRLAPIVVVTGTPAEVRARTDLAIALGIPDAVLVPVFGRTTREEALALRTTLTLPNRRIILVTGGAHLGRAAALFAHAGFTIDPAPADFIADDDRKPELRLELMRRLGQELAARVYHRVAGYL